MSREEEEGGDMPDLSRSGLVICTDAFVFRGSCFLVNYFVLTVADNTKSTGVRSLESAV